jgi:titin
MTNLGSGYTSSPTVTISAPASGTTATAFTTLGIGNTAEGMLVSQGASGNLIGGPTASARNIISDNFTGVDIRDAGSNATIQGNYIGTNSTGTSKLGNNTGVLIEKGVSGIVLGSNLISGNTNDGVAIDGASGNVLSGNLIGTNAAGTDYLGNGNGVEMRNIATGNIIDGTSARNIISGNSNAGVKFSGAGTTGNTVQANWIGLNQAGNTAVGNDFGVMQDIGVAGNTIGGSSPALGNVISGNTMGVQLKGGGAVVQNNRVGTNPSGTFGGLGNFYGVEIEGPANQIISNQISGNNTGLYLTTTNAASNVIQGNLIGTGATGNTGLANTGFGVHVTGQAHNNLIGGTTAAQRNVISGNTTADGIELDGVGTSGNTISGNYIGVGADGSTSLPNFDGVVLYSGPSNNTIGGTTPGSGNVIAFNLHGGVAIGNGLADTAVTGNAILGNSIYGNVSPGIDLAHNGITANDFNDADTGPNNLQNYPLLTSAFVYSGNYLVIQGTLNSSANTTYRIEFFANTSADASGFGQGQTYLGYINVTTSSNPNNAAFTAVLYLASPPPAGSFISATATDSSNNTSEFAQDIVSF